MRQHLATLSLIGTVGGCSLLYNPSNLPPVKNDGGPDAQIIRDADPTMLRITRVTPATLFEGEGDGSRSAVLAIHGDQMVKNGAIVTITAHAGSTLTPMLIVDNAMLDVADDGRMMSVPVRLPVDVGLSAAQQIRLDVTVTQNTAAGPVSFTYAAGPDDAAAVTLQGLDELINANVGTTTTLTPMTPPKVYSKVALAGPVRAAAGATEPLIIRATSTISIGSAAVSAAGVTGGAAGGRGGTAGPVGLSGNAGGAGTGPAFGLPSGGVGGFVGMDAIPTLDVPNRGSGGAGGDGTTLGAGGVGGGGGGSIEISAGGSLVIGPVDANGANGGNGANNGGAGSGGVVLLRSGSGSVMVTGTGASVAGGSGPGTPGASGRVRIDGPGTITAAGTHYRGPTFVPAGTPLIVRSEMPKLTLIGQPNKPFIYYFTNEDGSISRGPVTVLFPPAGSGDFTIERPLFRGTNYLCALVEGGSPGTAESGHCIQIVYLYKAPAV